MAEESEQQRSRLGRDEMNLAELPFATLSRRPDGRESIVHEGWITDRQGVRHKQRWEVGAGPLGLPTEYDERVYVALMKLTQDQGFESRRVEFSVHEVLQIMGLSTGAHEYEDVERSLKRLVGVTIYAEGSFWDAQAGKWRVSSTGFHILDKFWLRAREQDPAVREAEGCAAYVVWGEDIWKSFQAGYVKRLDLDVFYELESALARRLYRFLDKRMRYQDTYEIDIFELAGRLGMVRYKFPAQVKQKLQPAFDELIAKGWLRTAATVKHGEYTRFRFVKAGQASQKQPRARLAREDELTEPVSSPPAPLDSLWNRVQNHLRQAMTHATYDTHFPRTRLIGLVDGQATVEVPDENTRDWLTSRLEGRIREALAACGEEVRGISFVVHRARDPGIREPDAAG